MLIASSAIGAATAACLGFAAGAALGWLATRMLWQRKVAAATGKQARLSAQLSMEQTRGVGLVDQVRALQAELRSYRDAGAAKAAPRQVPVPTVPHAEINARDELFIASDRRPNSSGFEDTQVMMGDPRALLAEEAAQGKRR